MQIHQRRRLDNIVESAAAHGIPGQAVDGNDVLKVYEATRHAAATARAGQGPTLLELRTFRWRGHVGPKWDEDVGVKRKGDLQDWLGRDPIAHCEKQLFARGATEECLAAVRDEVEAEIDDAIQFALNSPPPAASTVKRFTYAGAA